MAVLFGAAPSTTWGERISFVANIPVPEVAAGLTVASSSGLREREDGRDGITDE
jgi:hypothetical protein